MIQPIPPRYTRHGQPLPPPLPLPRPQEDDDTTVPEALGPVCGWFDSSWALREGLAVTDLPDGDGAVAALWFADLAPRLRRSAQQA